MSLAHELRPEGEELSANEQGEGVLLPDTSDFTPAEYAGEFDELPAPIDGSSLNPAQQAAVQHVTGPLIIFAGAGSGKTKTVVHRIAHLILAENVLPFAILAVTFTNKAATEMRTRLDAMLGLSAKDIWVGTFHAVCARILRRFYQSVGLKPSFSIYDTGDQKRLMRRAIKSMGEEGQGVDPDRALNRVSLLKQEGFGPETLTESGDALLRAVYETYQTRLREANAVDFDDLLLKVLALSEGNGSPPRLSDAGRAVRRLFKHVLVDEFQDANRVQYRLASMLAAETGNLCVVGDDDQCHPPGVLVELAGLDETEVEELTSGDVVLGWSPTTEKRAVRRVEVGFRPYAGPIYTISAGGCDVPVTPNHWLYCRWAEHMGRGTSVWKTQAKDLDGMLGGAVAMGVIEVPLAEGGWAPIDAVRRSDYRGVVYSLDVAEDHAYSANGIVVGNSIYKWRGAVPAIFDTFAAEHKPTVVKLEQNYRSTGNVVSAASAVIAKAKGRADKTLWTAEGPGEPVFVVVTANERDEGAFVARRLKDALSREVPAHELAVLYRTHAQSRAIEDALRLAAVPYRVLGGQRFYERAEVKDVLAYLRLAVNLDSDGDFLRVVNVPPRGVGDLTAERLARVAEDLGVSLFEAVTFLRDDLATGEQQLGKKGLGAILVFYAIVDSLRRAVAGEKIGETPDPSSLVPGPTEMMAMALQRSGYVAMLRKGDDGEARIEILRELSGAMIAFEEEQVRKGVVPTLTAYLERVSLASDEERYVSGAVTLMTVHAAKGLEFAEVFLTGMEERVFPYVRDTADASEDGCDEDEERRLCYVAMTRARKRLWISWAGTRSLYGQTRVSVPSRFLRDIPLGTVKQGRSVGVAKGVKALPEPLPPPPPTVPAGTRWTERDADADLPVVDVGDKVVHRAWGVGTVTEVSGEFVSTKFPSHGEKRVHASFLRVL